MGIGKWNRSGQPEVRGSLTDKISQGLAFKYMKYIFCINNKRKVYTRWYFVD
jgi:hypothetical protein